MKRVLQAIALAVIALLIGLFAWRLGQNDAAKSLAGKIAAGDRPPAPAFDLSRLDGGGTLSLASLRGKAVVVNFWASWCVPCKEEAPRLEKAWQRYRQQGVVILGVDAQDFQTDARRFVSRYDLTYPVVHDGPGSTLGHWGVTGFPETFFVDRRGRLVGERIEGPVSDKELAKYIDEALSPESS
jgi:cytochrome c biogenesis protein CcmG, thiol:disulfide interchange protein DsbE